MPSQGYLGLGLYSILPGFAAGGRWYLRDDGDGFFVGLNLAGHWHNGAIFDTVPGAERDDLYWATLTPGYRFAWKTFFVQVAIGGGVSYTFQTWETPPSPVRTFDFLPDGMLAIGARFGK